MALWTRRRRRRGELASSTKSRLLRDRSHSCTTNAVAVEATNPAMPMSIERSDCRNSMTAACRGWDAETVAAGWPVWTRLEAAVALDGGEDAGRSATSVRPDLSAATRKAATEAELRSKRSTRV